VCSSDLTFRTGQPASLTKTLQRETPDGPDEQVVEISTFPLLDRVNRVVQVVEYIKEVTERIRLAERLEHARRLAELGEMAARVAHEVRNPLNAITGAAHYLSTEYSGDETLLKFTNLIQRQATRVNQVASDLLYVSKPLRTRFLPLQLNAVIDQSLDSLCEQFQGGRITVVRDLSPDLPLVQADELQVEQALQNLLRNAVEAMPMGGTLRIASALAAAGDFAEVRIQDTGSGIAEEHRGRIFQSFFTTKVKGTGLGLTIVQRVLRNHGGEITLEHPDAGGTAVLIRLPLTQEAGAASSSERTWPEHTGTPLP
jgi:two-component system sensor histidine kinase AtoS